MRVTNRMMTNSSLHNINNNKVLLNRLEQQYSSGKKIQKPSDDPIIAVRALKLRTNLTEINQYYEKNVPDAMSWMDVTESALKNINSIFQQMNTYCVQGASDSLTVGDRTTIAKNLTQLKDQIYAEGNSSYAGRYVFTGYKTDTSLLFHEDTMDTRYSISENFSFSDFGNVSYVYGGYNLNDYDADNPDVSEFTDASTLKETKRIRLSYHTIDMEPEEPLTISYTSIQDEVDEEDGTKPEYTFDNITTISATDPEAYNPEDGTVHFIPETGELIFPDDVYEEFRIADNIKINYEKSSFSKGELRPEHYFNCSTLDLTNEDAEPIVYTLMDQKIQYEVTFNQKLTINTQGRDAIEHGVGRDIDEILSAVNEVVALEAQIADTQKLMESSGTSEDQKEVLQVLKEQMETQLALQNKLMHQAFQSGIEGSAQYQKELNVTLADLGSRYVRLQLTESRLDSQQVEFEDLLSTNEDADLVETIIRYSSAETTYNASLSAASKIVQNSLLDFL